MYFPASPAGNDTWAPKCSQEQPVHTPGGEKACGRPLGPPRRSARGGRHFYKLPKNTLTPREEEVCRLLLEGLALKEVAAQCGISVSTADSHKRSLYQKLGLHSRAELFGHFTPNPVIDLASPTLPDLGDILMKLESIQGALQQISRHLDQQRIAA